MKITLGVLLAPIAIFFNNTFGLKTVLQTGAALKTVNGGGIEYQVAKTISLVPDLSAPFMIASFVLITWGIIDIIRKKKAKPSAPSAPLIEG